MRFEVTIDGLIRNCPSANYTGLMKLLLVLLRMMLLLYVMWVNSCSMVARVDLLVVI